MKYDIVSVGGVCVDLFMQCQDLETKNKKIHLLMGGKHLVDNLERHPGGSAMNTGIALSKLGFKTAIISKIGNDEHGSYLKQKMRANKITFLGPLGKEQTDCSVVISQKGKDRSILVHKSATRTLKLNEIKIKKLASHYYYLGSMIGSSFKTQCKIAKHAARQGSYIAFNPSHYVAEKGSCLDPIIDRCDLLILNHKEAQELTGKKAKVTTLLKDLHKRIPDVVITYGKEGAAAIRSGKITCAKPKNVPVLDPTGAGDAFASGYLAARMMCKDTKTALLWALAESNSILGQFGATNTLLTRDQLTKQYKKAGRIKPC